MHTSPGPTDRGPLVSVIVRSMDRATLDQALASVAAQSWDAVEVLVVDAKGTGHRALPGTCGRFELRLVAGAGPLNRSQAANAGLHAARGTWCCFLDDDDWLGEDHIEHLMRALQQAPGHVAAYAGVSCVLPTPEGELREVIRYNFPFDRARLLCENYLPIHAVLFSREAALAAGGFDPQLPIFEDWDFWLQLAARGPFLHVDRISAVYRLGSGDSGLYGNTALQEEMATRVMRKWLPTWQGDDLAALWKIGRRSLQEAAELAKKVEFKAAEVELKDTEIRFKDSQIAYKDSEVERLAGLVGERDAHILQQEARLQAQAEQLLEKAGALARKSQELDEVFEKLTLAGRTIEEGERTQQRLGQALQDAIREHAQAVELLQREQYTVLRPIARNLKRKLKPLYHALPPPLQRLARTVLRRPVNAVVPPAPVVPVEPVAENGWREALAAGDPGKATVLLFPVIDWHFRIQRPQHLARELARRGHRVLYLTTTFAQGTGPEACQVLGSPAPNVFLLQLALPGPHPNIYEDQLRPEQVSQLAETIAWLQREADLGPLVSMVNLPFWRPVARALSANLLVYDCMDYHAGFSTNTDKMLDEEDALLADCDLLVSTSQRLYELLEPKVPGKPHVLVRNGTEVDHFAHVPPALKLERDGRPVIGYFGAISEWFDMPLVVAAARAHPEWRIVLVGSTFGCDVGEAKKLENIEFTGEVPYAELPQWVHAFDVCMIPFQLTELTMCTNPVKVYEYLSAGKPVVATRMPELEAIADQVYLADAGDYTAKLEQALAEGRGDAQAKARRAWARQHSWAARADTLEQAIAACLPRASVVVLCYNNLALTQACLESVERQSRWPDLELVVVDNASTDGTPKWLREFAATRPWVKLVLNDRNLGFAAGNNVGLQAATGELLIMLNNDTQVSPGWIHGLWRHLVRDAALGMVGPVTNNIGNEAKIDPGYSDPAEMPAWAVARAVRHAGEQHPCRVLAFFCVALRRAVYEKVGGLDEAFGLGFFEDDDYCNRVRAAGWTMAIADDVFVHHHLSASFDQLKAARRQELFEKNKAIYESKWGPWVPHQYRQP